MFMHDDVLLNKAAVIERCVARAREEYGADPASFATNITRQDAAAINIQRACEACLDMANVMIRKHRLGLPQSAKDVFNLLAGAGYIETGLAENLQRMVGYRNIAVHDYQKLLLPITIAVIKTHLDDFLAFSELIVKRSGLALQ